MTALLRHEFPLLLAIAATAAMLSTGRSEPPPEPVPPRVFQSSGGT